jgi:hypothetical protein
MKTFPFFDQLPQGSKTLKTGKPVNTVAVESSGAHHLPIIELEANTNQEQPVTTGIPC